MYQIKKKKPEGSMKGKEKCLGTKSPVHEYVRGGGEKSEKSDRRYLNTRGDERGFK